MKYPVCNIELKMSDRQGIEIDYCPQCRGVWLDRGELDKINERYTSYQHGENSEKSEHKREYEDKSKHHGHHENKNKHKKRSFFEEIFD